MRRMVKNAEDLGARQVFRITIWMSSLLLMIN